MWIYLSRLALLMIFFSFIYSLMFEEDVSDVWDYEHSVEQYTAEGGTAKDSVQKQINKLQEWLKYHGE